jgi:hypothetical protein
VPVADLVRDGVEVGLVAGDVGGLGEVFADQAGGVVVGGRSHGGGGRRR